MIKGCGCDGICCLEEEPAGKLLMVDFLYLDLDRCGRCSETLMVLEESIREVGSVLSSSGINIELSAVCVETKAQAEALELISSPTIRINGNDICPSAEQSCCKDCSLICSDDVECRTWHFNGRTYESAPKAMLVDALLRAAYSPVRAAEEKEAFFLPENLERFFKGKRD